MDILPILLRMVRVVSLWLLSTGLEQMLSIILQGVRCCDIAPEKCLNTSIHSAVVPERSGKKTLGAFQMGKDN